MHVAPQPASRVGGPARNAPAVAVGVLLAFAAVLFVLGYDGGAFSVASRATVGIAVWWALFLAVGLGLVAFPRVPRAALAVASVLAAFAALTLASALWAPSAEDAFVEFNRVTLYLGVFALVVLLSRWVRVATSIDAIALSIVAVAVVSLVSRFFPGHFGQRQLPELLPSASTRLSFPVGYWNGLGILAGLGVPLLLRAAVAGRSAVVRGAALAPVPALVAVTYLASSRGGTAVAIAGGLAFLALTGRRWATLGALVVASAGSIAALAVLLARDELANGPLSSPEVPAQGRSAALLIALVCLACAVVYGSATALAPRDVRLHPVVGWAVAVAVATVTIAAVAAAQPVERFDDFRRPPSRLLQTRPDFVSAHFLSGNGSGRWQFWETALDEFERYPLRGGGAGSYESWWAQHGSISTFIRDAHSLYLETLAELGVAGGVLIGLVVAIGLVVGFVRGREPPASDQALAAAAAAFAAYAFAAGVDWMWELTLVSIVGMVALALLTGAAAHGDVGPPPGRNSRSLALVVATMAVALLAVAGQGISLLTNVQIEESKRHAARGELVAAIESANTARKLQPWAASPYFQRGLVEEQAGALRQARRSLEETIERDSGDWRPWLAKARVELESGDVREATRSLERAAALNPRSPAFARLR